MSRAANIDDFVKSRMSGPPLQQFQSQMRGDATLTREVGDQQMVLNLVSRQANSNLRAQIQEVRSTYENQMQISARRVDAGSKPLPKKFTGIGEANENEAASVIKVILYLENYRAELQDLKIDFKQEIDQIGQPSSKVTGARILLTLPVQKNTKIWSWMIDPTKKLNGELSYINANGKESKRIEFEEAYCITYKLKYDAFSTEQIKQNTVEQITIVPKKMKFKGATFQV